MTLRITEAHRRPRARRDDSSSRLRRRRRPPPPRPAHPAATAPAGEAPAGEPGRGAVTGAIIVSGSSTVEPISTGVAEAFAAANPGFKLHDRRARARATASRRSAPARPTSPTPRARSRTKRPRPAPTPASSTSSSRSRIDGMSVLTSVNNTAVTCLSFADLYALIGPESTGFAKWSDAAALAKELGSNTVFPDADADDHRSRRGVRHLRQLRRARARQDRRDARQDRPGDQAHHDPPRLHRLRQRQRDHRRHRGQRHLARLGRLRVRRGEQGQGQGDRGRQGRRTGPASPDARPSPTARYPLSRSLYIYVNKAKAAANPAVVAYVDYYLADGTISTVLETVPYVNLPADDARRRPPRPGTPRSSSASSSANGSGQLGGPTRSSILHPVTAT